MLILSDELRPRDQKKSIINDKHPKIIIDKINKVASPNERPSQITTLKKTHQRSQSDASALLQNAQKSLRPVTLQNFKLTLGDLSSGRAFDNGCVCFETCQGVVNDLRGKKTECSCMVSIVSTYNLSPLLTLSHLLV